MRLKIFSFLLILFGIINAQNTDSLISVLKDKFSSFEYKEAILLSTEILEKKEALPKQDLVEIYRIKAVSHFSISEEKLSEENIVAILMLDSTYILDPVINSPKIITFFNEVKKNLPQKISDEKRYLSQDIIENKLKSVRSELNNSIARSLIFPGWGHLYLNKSTKGVLLTSLAALSLGSTIYYVNDCTKKEKAYLTETNRALITEKYDKYNTSYKMKYVSITALIVTWVYTQFDLIFLEKTNSETFELTAKPLAFNNSFFQLKINF